MVLLVRGVGRVLSSSVIAVLLDMLSSRKLLIVHIFTGVFGLKFEAVLSLVFALAFCGWFCLVRLLPLLSRHVEGRVWFR